MTAEAVPEHLIPAKDYLAGELSATERHEFLNGVVYSMAGATNRHEIIAANLLGTLLLQLDGRACRPFGGNTKIRVRQQDDLRFYYPDALVVCRQNSLDDQYQDEPALIFEVISESTRRTDEQEKRLAYCSIPSLQAYILIEQDRMAATVWRRSGRGFISEKYSGSDTVVGLSEVENFQLPLGRIYRDTGLSK